jgi:hypothetical protein
MPPMPPKRPAPAAAPASQPPAKKPRKPKKPLPAETDSSPLKPLPPPEVRDQMAAPVAAAAAAAFVPVSSLGFDRYISPDLPQDSLLTLFKEFCPEELVADWARYMNVRYIRPPGSQTGPWTKNSRQNAWMPTSTNEIYLFLGMLIFMAESPRTRVADYWQTKQVNRAASTYVTRINSWDTRGGLIARPEREVAPREVT